jgi:hypothetical protein
MKEEIFSNYFLVGGTSLALQIGHRNSVDIDLFGNQEINHDFFFKQLNTFGKTEISKSSKNILITEVEGIKVDFVNYQYQLLENPIEIDGIRMLSKKDIAAMKLNAITGRGSKKDFIDLYFLLQEFSLKQMIGFYNQKYFDGSEFLLYKSLNYFEEADIQPQPKVFKEFDWDEAKKYILGEVKKL